MKKVFCSAYVTLDTGCARDVYCVLLKYVQALKENFVLLTQSSHATVLHYAH